MISCWFWKVQLLLLTVHAESECGYYYDEQKNYEVPQVRIETKLGSAVTFEIPIYNGDRNVFHKIVKPNGEEVEVLSDELIKIYNVNNTLPKNYSYIFGMDDNNVHTIDKENEIKPNGILSNIMNNKTHHYKFSNEPNVVAVGPMREDDHGQWMTLTCYWDERDDLIKIFRIYDISIQEEIDTIPKEIISHPGKDVTFDIGKRLVNLEACQLILPDKAGDREYERNVETANSCGYVVKGVKKEDAGKWTIVALAKIIYIRHLDVRVLEVT